MTTSGLTGCLCRAAWGSSPLARGLPATARHQVAPRGIIPARAGFTAPSPWSTARAEDHPRSRGVYGRTPLYPGPGRGSSPLARGLPVSLRRPLNTAGIIPARAGFTPKHIAGRAPHMDHPRSRGVYNISDDDPAGEGGSSPLARGLRRAAARVPVVPGIIPARAGFTARPSAGVARNRDHPRSRGVYSSGTCGRTAARGSSPLARGLRRGRSPRPRWPGIIPARAGFTPPPAWPRRGRPDHPRSRGVYARLREELAAEIGSSPLARGLHQTEPSQNLCVRIIPARAGFTLSPPTTSPTPAGSSPLARGLRRPGRRRSSDAPDHPRSRGVYATRSMGGAISRGSSPLARGLRPAPRARGPARWIIPARAGFTDRTRRGPLICRDHPRSRGVYAA